MTLANFILATTSVIACSIYCLHASAGEDWRIPFEVLNVCLLIPCGEVIPPTARTGSVCGIPNQVWAEAIACTVSTSPYLAWYYIMKNRPCCHLFSEDNDALCDVSSSMIRNHSKLSVSVLCCVTARDNAESTALYSCFAHHDNAISD